jgi:hypothetical protein
MNDTRPKTNVWVWIILGVLFVAVVCLGIERWRDYKWEHAFWRSYAHYYYCDSIHYSEVQCQALSNHIPPPPPPPM